jgi:hypothetical protein
MFAGFCIQTAGLLAIPNDCGPWWAPICAGVGAFVLGGATFYREETP